MASFRNLLGAGKSGSPGKDKDAKSGGPLDINPALELENHKAPVCFIHVQGNLMITAAIDGTVTLWDWTAKKPYRSFKTDLRHCVIRGNILITTGSLGSVIQAWDLRSSLEEPVARLVGHTGAVKEMQHSGEFLYSCSADGSVRTWDLQFAEEDHYNPAVQVLLTSKITYATPASAVNCFGFFGASLVIGHADGNLRVWKTPNGQASLGGTWAGHTAAITCLRTTASGLIASGSADGTVRLWVGSTGVCQAILKLKSPIISIAIRGDMVLVLPTDSKEVHSFSLKNAKPTRRYEGHTGSILAMHVTLLHLYTSSQDGTLRRFELRRGHCENIFAGHSSSVNYFKIRGSLLLSGENSGTICMWDVLQHDLETLEEARQEADFLQEELNYETREVNTYLSVQDLSSRALAPSKSAPNVAHSHPVPPLFASTPAPASALMLSPKGVSAANMRASAPVVSSSTPFSNWVQFFELCRVERNDAVRFSNIMAEEGMELQQIPDLTPAVLRELNIPGPSADSILATTKNARLVRKGDMWRLEAQ